MRHAKLVLHLLLALLPSVIKVPVYRLLYGYRIGKGVRIGFSPLIGVGACRIGDHVRIGSFNIFYRVQELVIGDRASIGYLNVFRGGQRIKLGDYAAVLRQNVFNAIIESDFDHSVESVLDLGAGVSVATGHWLDFSAGIQVGAHTVIGGRGSSFWTHNRQRGRAISLGDHCYLGSEVRVAPGVEVAPLCVVALGSVLTGRYEHPRSLIGGNPAAVVRPLLARDLPLVTRKTRNDIPDELALLLLPDDLRPRARTVGARPDDAQSDLRTGINRRGDLIPSNADVSVASWARPDRDAPERAPSR